MVQCLQCCVSPAHNQRCRDHALWAHKLKYEVYAVQSCPVSNFPGAQNPQGASCGAAGGGRAIEVRWWRAAAPSPLAASPVPRVGSSAMHAVIGR